MIKNRKRIVVLLAAGLLCFSGCGKTENTKTAEEIPSVTRDIFAMDTYMSITGYGERAEEAVNASLEEIRRLDSMLSVGNPDSEVSVINEKGQGSISEDTALMVEKALEVGERTEGKFDITIYPLMVEWGFTSDNFHVPDQKRLDQLLEHVDYRQVEFDRSTMTVTLGQQQGMDLGGIAKGFTSDRIMEIFREYDLVSGMVTLGGNVECLNTKTDGSPWRCGICDPYDEAKLLGVITVEDTAVITSGAYERNFVDEKTGKLYHHIIDPATGYPANNGLISVTIISKNGMLADALSTSMYILGLDGAIDYWKTYGSDFDMVLMTENNKVYITKGIEEAFSSEYPTVVVE